MLKASSFGLATDRTNPSPAAPRGDLRSTDDIHLGNSASSLVSGRLTAGHPAGLGDRQRHAVRGEHVDQPRLAPHPARRQHLGRRGYTYAWWTHEFRKSGHTVPAFYGWGWGGQVIAVFPEHDAVAVFTGAHYNAASSPAKILGAHVIRPCSMPTRQASGRQQTPRAESHDSGPACREDRQVSRSASRLMLSIILRLITKLTTSSGKRPNTSRLVQSGP